MTNKEKIQQLMRFKPLGISADEILRISKMKADAFDQRIQGLIRYQFCTFRDGVYVMTMRQRVLDGMDYDLGGYPRSADSLCSALSVKIQDRKPVTNALKSLLRALPRKEAPVVLKNGLYSLA